MSWDYHVLGTMIMLPLRVRLPPYQLDIQERWPKHFTSISRFRKRTCAMATRAAIYRQMR